MILGIGSLATRMARDVRTGTASLEVRGDVTLTLDEAVRENYIWHARLRIHRGERLLAETRMDLNYHVPFIDPDEVETDMHWRGEVTIDGYPMRVSIDPKTWVIRFFDMPRGAAE